MSTWILIMIMHVGPMGSGNSNAITTQEFSSKETCEQAGTDARKLASGTVKEIKTVCVRK